MKIPYPHLPSKFATIALLCCFAGITQMAQAQNTVLCEDGDCPSSIFSVQLDAELQGSLSSARTEQFKSAYLQVKQIKSQLAQKDLTWESRYKANALGGRSCVRLNQLESHFAYEYERNPDFQKFIGQNEASIQSFKERGFEGSRRGLNLSARMERNCPQEVNKLEKEPGPSLEDLPLVFMKMGQVLGYFDEEGNMIKPLQSFSGAGQDDKEANEIDLSKLSKGKQIDYLKEKVAQLPLGPQKRDEIAAIGSGLKAARPKQDQLDKSLEGLEPRFAAQLPRPPDVQGKLETNKGTLQTLQSFKPKNPKKNLTPRIDKLLEKGKELDSHAQQLGDKANSLKSRYEEISASFDGLQSEADQRIAAGEKMQAELDDLEKRKAELALKLEDKPKKILDELTQQVMAIDKEVEELSKKIESENRQKDEVLKKLDELIQSEKEVADQLGQLEKEADGLASEQVKLEEEIKKLEWEAEEIKKEETRVTGLQEKLANLKSEDAVKERIAICEEEVKSRREKVGEVEESRNKYLAETDELSKIPGQVAGKLSDLKLFLNKLKLGYDGIPVSEKSLRKIEQLIEKAGIIGSSAELLTDKQNRLQEQIDGFGQNLEKTKDLYDSMTANLDDLREELRALSTERSGLQRNLEQGIEDLEQTDALVNDFLNRYNGFGEKSKCKEEELIETLKKEQAGIERELKDLGAEMVEVTRYEENLVKETEEADKQIQEHTVLTKQLKQEEETLKVEFGQDLSLKPVQMEDWKEATQVDRPYWEASVHPDEELVKGYKGRYFEINLKDAEKNAKVLFAPGRYSMDKKDFRTNYGATIGSFVNEALIYLKKSDEGKVKLFIQGSADITGQNTFRGKLDPDYQYGEITILPLDLDKVHFLGEAQTLQVPATGFRNDDLPNLRSRYLKDIIGAYTKKFDPILLQGVVQSFEGKGERNASIYLFFPEELLERY